ncbi:Altered inheritance of mitochondria protein 6-like [Colletotrichum gloeosporioides]|uniref:Altered inheritance of mitochondria protein 6 n=1 Tax=Colletotrichum gloeosporioides TaxID=474922 RepID=A0A8H4CX65_COLGL|nr:Altered inheritance of mitochondria protein 6-like [Colletotrichum gloeosporioides]KAF3811452.1 Altered inheritance of mitochondria protein 6-like [Colletotrichum gloeosporioides]
MPSSSNASLDAISDRFRQLWSRSTTTMPRYRDSPEDEDSADRDVEAPPTPTESCTSEDQLLTPAYMTPKPWTRKRSFFMCGAVWLAMLFIFVLLNLVLFAAREVWDSASEEFEEASIVVPIPCHSHNDYWRRRPVFSALQVGCVGIEADVWLYGTELFVGHDRWSLREDNTFTSLYIDPLVRLLEERNSGHENYTDQRPRGIYEANPNQTLILLVDLKTNGAETWPEVVRQLQPLRDRGWLSTIIDGQVNYGPITVVGTGNTPFDMLVQNTTYRDYFFDAPLTKLDTKDFNPTNSYYTSVSFKKAVGIVWFGDLSKSQITKLREQIKQAHSRSLKVRYWDLPAWPISIRNHIWGILIREGVDILNVDDLKGARREWDLRGWPTLGANSSTPA